MRRFVVQVVVDTVALLVVLVLLGLIDVKDPFPFGTGTAPILLVDRSGFVWLELVVTGVFLTVLYGVLKPALVALTGRLLIWTLGTFQIVVIAVVLTVAAWLSPITVHLANPGWLWVLVAAALLGGLRTALGAVLGLAGPPTSGDIGQRVWRFLDRLPTPRRSSFIENLRLEQLYDTIYGYGVEIALEGTPLASIRRWSQRVLLGEKDPVAGMSTAAKVRLMLQQLGPTYVKLGQIVASRGEALPEDWGAQLSLLQSNVQPVPWEEARGVMVSELGKPPEEIFATFDTDVLAAASTAQVYRATLPDGTAVAVKVQRPFIVAKTKADLGVMQEIARIGSRRLGVARKIDLAGIVKEFAAGVLRELDYGQEAYNARRLAEELAKFPTIHIPVVYGDYSTTRVLTEEFVSGIKINNTAALDEAKLDRCAIAEVFVRSLVKQVLIDGFFHGDPHPGNILVDPATGHIIYIDLGMVGQLSSEQRISLLDLIFSITNRDYEGVATTMIALSHKTPAFDEAAFRSTMDATLRRFLEYGEAGSLAAGLNAVVSVVYDSGLRLDNQLTIGLKALIQSEETARALSPDIDIAQAAFAESREAMVDRLSQENVERLLRKEAIRLGRQFLQRAPKLESAIWKWVDQFGQGQLSIKLDTSDLGTQFGTLNKIGGMLSVGMILAGALVGLAIVAVMMLQPAVANALGPLPGLAAAAFLVLLIYAVRQVRRFVRMTEDEEEKY